MVRSVNMRRKQMSRALISFVVFLMIGSAGSILAYGQPPIDTPPGIPDADADQNAAMFEDIATRDPSEFNIVYFVSPDSLSDDKHPLGPAALDVLDATIAVSYTHLVIAVRDVYAACAVYRDTKREAQASWAVTDCVTRKIVLAEHPFCLGRGHAKNYQ